MSVRAQEFRILVVDDDPSFLQTLDPALQDWPAKVLFADTPNAITRNLESSPVHLGVIHLHAGTLNLLDPLTRALRQDGPHRPIFTLVEEDGEAALAAAAAGVEGCALAGDSRNLRRLLGQALRNLSDLNQARAAQGQLEDIQDRYNLLLESSSEAIAYLHEGLHVYANPAYLEQFGYTEFSELEGQSIFDLFSPGESGVDLKQILRGLSRGEMPAESIHLQAHRAGGDDFSAEIAFSPARYAGEPCIQMMVREQAGADDSHLKEELEKLRTRDLLTGLLNRQSFLERLRGELDNPPREGMMAVVLVQLDDHAGLQTKLGAGVTDALIRQTSELFQTVAGEAFVPCRLRDQILAMRAWVGNRQEAEQLATCLVEAFSGHILEVRDRSITVTASVGLALGGSQSAGIDEIVGQAEMALNEAIRAGGNSYVRFRPRSDAGEGADLAQWGEKLRHALNNQDFRLVTLPITSMEDDDLLIQEVEARLRLEDSDEILMPDSYLPAARAAGLATELDRDLVSSLIAHIAASDQRPDSQWLVPLNAASLNDEEFIGWLQEQIEAEKLPPAGLIIGLREHEVREQLRQVQKFTRRFLVRGVRFALLEVSHTGRIEPLLKNLELSFVKLHPESVATLGGKQENLKALEQVVHDAATHDIQVISPKVENTSDLASLWQLGITLVQDDFVREEA